MHRKTITITEEMDAFIAKEVSSGRYGNDSEFVRQLIRREMERSEAHTALRVLIEEAERSGLSERSPHEILEAFMKPNVRHA